MGRLDGKIAVVTGGGNGIGRACCRRFAAEGADIVVADLLEEAGKETVAMVEDAGRRAVFVAADAASPDDNEAVMQAAVDQLGGLHVLVTSAGISGGNYRSSSDVSEQLAGFAERGGQSDPAQNFLEFPLSDWNKVLEVNLTGTLLAVQSAARRMSVGGSIITIASIAGKTPEAGTPSYSVSKAGVWMLTKFASMVLSPKGIRVNAIGPGFIETNMTAIVTAIPELSQRFLAQVPMARMGKPEEIAATAAFIASDDSSYTTGEIFHVDGGFYTE